MKRINKNSIFDNVVYTIFGLFLIFVFLLNIKGKNLIVEFSFLLIGIVSYLWFVFEKRVLSVNKMMAVFSFVFCSLAPLIQFENDAIFWGISGFEDVYYIYANFLILLFLFVYLFSYYFIFKKTKKSMIQHKNNIVLTKRKVALLLFISLISFAFLFFVGRITPRESGYNTASVNSFVDFGLKVLRYVPVGSLIIFAFCLSRQLFDIKKSTLYFCIIFLFLLVLIIFNPLTGQVGRYMLLATYLTVFSLFTEKIKHKSIFLLIVVLGFVLIFPTMNFFKYHSISQISSFKFSTVDFTDNDYDAYYLFLSTIRYVKQSHYSFGLNIISSIFSFVPRSIWTRKSEPSGYIISLGNGAYFTNVSCPMFAEYYYAFGIGGLVVFTFLTAVLFRKFDVNKNTNIVFYGINAIFAGNILPLMRGAMLPVLSFILALCVSFILCYSLIKLNLGQKYDRFYSFASKD